VKHFIYILLLMLSFSALRAQSTDDRICGKWQTADQQGIIQVYRSGARYYGSIAGGQGNLRTDRNNPDPALRTRSLTGLVILSDFVFSGGNKWTGGKIYDPSNGKTYSCNLQLKTNGVLEVRGYIGVSLFGRTERWTRIE